MEFEVFYSWQSDLPNTKKYIASCLNAIASEKIKNHTIKITSDARNSNGAVNLADTLFKKIRQSEVFVADLTIINSNSQERKCCNPNVLIELGYAINHLGTENVLIVFDTEYGKVEDLPFDIRQNKIIQFSSKNKKNKLKNYLQIEIQKILNNVNPAIYDYLYSEINNRIITHLMEFTKIFYFNNSSKTRYDYTYFITKNESELEHDIKNNTFIGFELFKNLNILENEFESFLNQKVNNDFLTDNISRLLSKVVLSMKSISKFLNYEPFFKKTDTLSSEYTIISAQDINPHNDNKLILLRQSGNPINHNGIVISSNYIYPNKIDSIRHIYKCVNAEYFSKVIKNYIASITEWSMYTNNIFFTQLNQIKNQIMQ